jgi:ATP-binding cassette subfamily G (WHITE) protein 2
LFSSSIFCLSFILEDIISGTLTVRENLLFSANVRLPRSIKAHERIDRVNQVIRDLDLQSCADTLIGTDFVRGVSGGEKKRTSIGMELVLSPNVLFLDEPTTGNSNSKYVKNSFLILSYRT